MSVLDARGGAVLKTVYLQSADQLQRSALARGGATYGQARFGYSAVMTQVVVDQKAGRVYILEPGLLSVVDAGSSAVLRNIPVSMDATALALDPRNGHLFVARAGDSAGSSGSLDVLDPQSGRMLRTFTVGVAPTALVVDQHIGRLYVVDRGGEQKVANPLNWLPDGVRQHLPLGSSAQSTTRMLPGSIFVLSLDKL